MAEYFLYMLTNKNRMTMPTVRRYELEGYQVTDPSLRSGFVG
jgi:hypothetical protein